MTLIDKAEALLPCPFCGSTMQVAMRDAMLCLECYAAGPQDEDRKTAWNRRALPARGVVVKPLVWEQISDRTIEAAGVGSTHRIQTAQDGSVRWQSRYMGKWHNAPSVNAAKAAAQADYEARILAALEPAPTDAAHVNETPKSEHDGADVLTAAQAREAAMQELIDAYEDIIDYAPLVLAKKDQWKRVEAAKEKLGKKRA